MRRNGGSLTLLICGVTALVMLCAAPASAAPEDDYDLAVGLYKKERWDGAADAFRAFLKANPQHPHAETARLYLGLALVNADENADARDVLREFVKLHPKSKNLPDALYRLGEASYTLGDYQQAEQDLVAFLDRYADHELGEWALPYLADAELRLDKPEQAAKRFQQAIEKYPSGALATESRFGLARTYEALEKPDDAIAIYRKLAEGDGPRAAPALLRVATLLYDGGKYADAAKEFQSLVERFPKSSLIPAAQLNAGFALYRSGEFQQAVEHLEAAANESKQTAVATHWVGMARKSLGDSAGASAAFRTVVEKHAEAPIAGESLFQWADVALRDGDYDEAVRLFEQVASRDPDSTQASDAIHFAGEAALLGGDVDRASAFIDRFTKEYGRTAYRMQNRLLAGRVLEARAEALPLEQTKDRDALEREALATYAAVLDETEVVGTQMKSRFSIARLREARNEPAEAIEAISPVLDIVAKEGADSSYLGALVIAARARLALDEPDAAVEAATTYLELAPKGDQADAALAARAAAHMADGRAAEAKADWSTLKTSHPKSSLILPTTRDLAENAYDQEDWATAAEYFAGLAEIAAGAPEEAVGLSGLGWSLHKAGQFAESANAFGRLLERFPKALPLAPEAAYMKGKALQDAGDLAAATTAYRAAFERFAPIEPAATGDEAAGPLRNAYLSGLQLARILRLQDKIDEADAAYTALTAKFPKPRNFDELLDEWALLHYEAGDYAKADAIFRRIVAETPDSPAAANARLSLAESALFAGNTDEAKAGFEALSKNEKTPGTVRERALSLLVSLAAEAGDWKNTESLAQTFVTQYPEGRDRPIVLYQLGEALLHQNQPEKAVEILSQVDALRDEPAVRSEPWFPRVQILLAEAAFQKKEYDTAVENLKKVQSLKPQPKFAYLADELLGRIYKNQAKFDEARKAFQSVLDDPNARRTATAARAQYEIAQTYFLQQRWEEARTEAFKVYTLYKFPEWQAPALYMAGLSDEALGEMDKAIAAFNDVVKEFPQTDYARQARAKLEKLGGSKG
ncbi:MAG: tetratricopeptide repeat protein [Planctomycetaceae bacterium]